MLISQHLAVFVMVMEELQLGYTQEHLTSRDVTDMCVQGKQCTASLACLYMYALF